MQLALKSLLIQLIVPLSLILAVGTVGVSLLWSKTWARLSRWLVGAAFGALLLFSNRGVSTCLLHPLESTYARAPHTVPSAESPDPAFSGVAIVVLGGGQRDDDALSSWQRLNPAALSNLVEAVRLTRRIPAADLIVSGGHGRGSGPHALLLEHAAVALGVDPRRIARLDSTYDTSDEAQEVGRRLGSKPFLLVTSAAHMPRAMALMQRAGTRPIPCPAYYLSNPSAWTASDFLSWDTDALEGSRKAVKEHLALLWIRLHGPAAAN